jgi:hypothetical protein
VTAASWGDKTRLEEAVAEQRRRRNWPAKLPPPGQLPDLAPLFAPMSWLIPRTELTPTKSAIELSRRTSRHLGRAWLRENPDSPPPRALPC